MRFVRYAILVVIASFAIGPALEAADSDSGGAPFGLQWGMSLAQAQGLGVMLTKDPRRGFGASYVATNLPKMIGDVRAIVLSFGFDDKLWRVVAISKDFVNDPYGSAVQRRYEELAGELAQKYGNGKKESGASGEFYADPKNFVYAVQSGNAWHYTNYKTTAVNVQLGIGANDMSTAYYQIIFENNSLRSDFEKAKKTSEKGAL